MTVIAVVAVAVVLTACSGRTVYSYFRSTSLTGWEQDSTLVYDVSITDTLATYNVILSVRHTAAYPYQNIWFFVDNGLTGGRDTLEYYLADQRGRWLGNGWGERKEMPCLIMQGAHFPHSGTYRFGVQHGMREERLRGVSEVGLMVEKQ